MARPVSDCRDPTSSPTRSSPTRGAGFREGRRVQAAPEQVPPPPLAGSGRRAASPHRCTERETGAGRGGGRGEDGAPHELPRRQKVTPHPDPPDPCSPPPGSRETRWRRRSGQEKAGEGGGDSAPRSAQGEEWSTSPAPEVHRGEEGGRCAVAGGEGRPGGGREKGAGGGGGGGRGRSVHLVAASKFP